MQSAVSGEDPLHCLPEDTHSPQSTQSYTETNSMKIAIDNFQGQGAVDYSIWLDASVAPRIERKLNRPSTLQCSFVGNAGFGVPAAGASVKVTKASGDFLFTGYLTEAARCEYLGEGQAGPVYRYEINAASDQILLDQKALPSRAPFVARSAGSALKQFVQDLLPGAFDTSQVQDVDLLASYEVNPQEKFSDHAGAIAAMVRGSCRFVNGAAILEPLVSSSYQIDEADADFSPAGLELQCPQATINDVTVIGLDEPQDYVRDYFVGDGLSQRFYLSQSPFQQSRKAIIEEEYRGTALDPTIWEVSDPTSAISVNAQELVVNGGAGQDGGTVVQFLEQIEMGGALELQHGEVSFTAASRGVIGGLYSGGVESPVCVAGFQITPSGAVSNIQALINGAATGPVISTIAGHRYLLTTYLYSQEVYREGEIYHSPSHPAGSGVGGAVVAADVRVVLELVDINPLDPSTLVGTPTVLFDDVIANAPGFCKYALVNAIDMHCSVTSTYAARIALAEVRTALPNSNYNTQLVESQADGGQCYIASSTTLDFYPQYVPALNTLIVASYRGYGRAVAEVADTVSSGKLAGGNDDGVRAIVRTAKVPGARTQADCENAALAILDTASGGAWSGKYRTWSDFLPSGARDIFPGDAVAVHAPSRNANFTAIVRAVEIEMRDPRNDRAFYTIEFANEAASPIAVLDEASAISVPMRNCPVRLAVADVGSYYLSSLVNVQITQVTSTTVQVDTGTSPAGGMGIEVRMRDSGWGVGNDRNLLGRFSARTFSLPRLGRSQTYFLRMYDGSASPVRYSRYSAAVHIDCPLGYTL